MFSTADALDALYDAVIVTAVFVVTIVVLIGNVPLVTPAAMVMVVGTEAATLLVAKAITAPPAGAGALSVTVPLAEFPPHTLPGLTVRAETVIGAGTPT